VIVGIFAADFVEKAGEPRTVTAVRRKLHRGDRRRYRYSGRSPLLTPMARTAATASR
jgi:hypothetical protein